MFVSNQGVKTKIMYVAFVWHYSIHVWLTLGSNPVIHLLLGKEQCDQIGRFLQVLGSKLCHKIVQICWWLFGLFLILSLLFKKFAATFWAIFGKIRQLFIPSSGHTGKELQIQLYITVTALNVIIFIRKLGCKICHISF